MLLNEIDRKRIARDVLTAINKYCAETYDDGFRSHLGASMIGEKCNRFLWYSFRWAIEMQYRGETPEEQAENKGRMQRLFNRGHKTEDRFVEWLRGIGFQVRDVNPDTGEQYRIADIEGHFGGSNDGETNAPHWVGYPETFLLEFKTYNDKTFKRLQKENSVKVANPKHFAQMCTYGYKRDIKYALYFAINKNDDDIYLEVVELDHGHGAECIRKAEYVITSYGPPPRLHEIPTHIDCKFCDAASVCHQGAPYLRNCRSCHHAMPIANKEWHCGKFKGVIPKDFLPKGCAHWHPVGRVK